MCAHSFVQLLSGYNNNIIVFTVSLLVYYILYVFAYFYWLVEKITIVL